MKRWQRIAGAALVLGAGAAVGATKLRKVYDWRTVWEIDAPPSIVYEALTTADESWWPPMKVVSSTRTVPLREGATIDFEVLQAPSVRKLAPPFRIHAVYTTVEPDRRLRQHVTGDLNGVLEVHLTPTASGTRVTWDWYVSVGNPALNLLGFALEGVFRHSHDSTMDEGEQGLRAYCAGLKASDGKPGAG
jgi:uncharacterized protein YndB with AHSA1/START domain